MFFFDPTENISRKLVFTVPTVDLQCLKSLYFLLGKPMIYLRIKKIKDICFETP